MPASEAGGFDPDDSSIIPVPPVSVITKPFLVRDGPGGKSMLSALKPASDWGHEDDQGCANPAAVRDIKVL